MTQPSYIIASPATTGVSVAYQVMADAAAFYLQNGGPQVAREHVDRLAGELKFYPDCTEAYHLVLNTINEAERRERREAAEQRQQELRDMVMTVMGAQRPAAQAQQKAAVRTTKADRATEPGVLPPQLQTERALRMWQKVQGAGFIGDDYQPLGLSRTEAALLADEMATRLGIWDKWKTFERLWGRNNMREDLSRALNQRKSLDFQDRLKSLFADIQ